MGRRRIQSLSAAAVNACRVRLSVPPTNAVLADVRTVAAPSSTRFTGRATVSVMRPSESVRRERELQFREAAVAAREAAADAREIALEMRETTLEMLASGVSRREVQAAQREVQADQRELQADQRELQAHRREVQADRREARADQRDESADEREDEFSRLHPPTAEVADEMRRETLDRALVQLRRAEDAVIRARSHLARAEHVAEGHAGDQEDGPEPVGG